MEYGHRLHHTIQVKDMEELLVCGALDDEIRDWTVTIELHYQDTKKKKKKNSTTRKVKQS